MTQPDDANVIGTSRRADGFVTIEGDDCGGDTRVEGMKNVKHTVVISDVHICQAVPGDDLWMRYRQRQFFPDDDFAGLFERMHEEARGDALSVVFNGDLFDFDAPPVVDGAVHLDGAPCTEAAAISTLELILADHSRFVDALGAMLAAGHEVVFVSGNHDAQLSWPGVRASLTRVLLASARAHEMQGDAETTLADRIVFRSWFHRTSDGIHIEHGNQYDHYCAFRYPNEPFTADRSRVQPTMGSLSFRHLVSRMGYFNPHVDSTFMLSARAYVSHWLQYYVGSPHSLGKAWARGAVRILKEMFAHREPRDEARSVRSIRQSAQETGSSLAAVEKHAALFAVPSDEEAHSVLRELWLDRVAFGAAGAVAVSAAAIGGAIPGVALAAAGSVGVFAAYELLLPKPVLDDTYSLVFERQCEIARIHGARAVVFGHTHQPFGRWADGVFHGNSGTWSAAYLDPECTRPIDDGRPVIWLRSDDSGAIEGGLHRWSRGVLSIDRAERPVLPAASLVPAAT